MTWNMGYNDNLIRTLRKCFNPPYDAEDGRYDSNSPFTNCALVFAYNGTGKTRLSYDFAHYAHRPGTPQHTLYYNAYTEDLFTWNNDLENNTEHRLLINKKSSLIKGLAGYELSYDLRKYLQVFTDIDFVLHYDKDNEDIPDYVTFSKMVKRRVNLDGEWTTEDFEVENIKISRGEERLFVWCFFRCILDQVIGDNDAYKDIEYIYIDDPMSSLDDNNVIAFAQQLYSIIQRQLTAEIEAVNAEREFRRIKFVVSSHHALFFHVMLHALKNSDRRLRRYYLTRNRQNGRIILKQMSDNKTPFYYNVAMMSEIKNAIENNKLYTFHFNILRSVMEKIKEFFGHRDLAIILEGVKYKNITYDHTHLTQEELTDFYSRVVNVFSHQASMYAPLPMNDDNKEWAIAIFTHLVEKYQFVLPNLNDYHRET